MGKKKLGGKGEEEKKNGNVVKMPRSGAADRETSPALEEEKDAGFYKGAKKALRHAVKAEVKKKSKELAEKLVGKAAAGDTHSTDQVFSLIENEAIAARETKKKKKKKDGPSWAELLASEPEWDGEDGGEGNKAS